MYSLGELSRDTGVKVPTIRYYEQIGLLRAPARSSGGQRRYSQDHLEQLSFIRHARELGLGIGAIRELIELSAHPERPCAEANRIAMEQLEKVRAKIASLKKLEVELQRIATQCAGNQIKDCYVIRALADHNLCASGHE